MDTIQAILERRSIRKYKPEPIPEEDLATILEATRQAPSAANRQPWHFVVVTDPEQRKRVADACRGQTWIADAGCIVVGIGLPDVSAKWYKTDVGIAMENMVLAAWSLGYGTCWIGAFEADQVKQVCGIPEELDIVACLPIGVPAVSPEARERRSNAKVFFPRSVWQLDGIEGRWRAKTSLHAGSYRYNGNVRQLNSFSEPHGLQARCYGVWSRHPQGCQTVFVET